MSGALVCHPGTQHSARLAECLLEKGLLSAFYTGWRSPLLNRFIQTTGNRALSAVLRPRSHQIWLPEVAGKILQSCGCGGQSMIRIRNAWFQRMVPNAAIRAADFVIGFDTSAWLLTRRCKTYGKPLILDRTTIHRSARAQIRARHQLFARGQASRPDPIQDEIETEEFDGAAAIVVASRFAKNSLVAAGLPEKKIEVIAYGVDLDHFSPAPPPPAASNKVKFLFVGNLVPEKGVQTLLAAWRGLAPDAAELWLVGPGDENLPAADRALPNVTIFGKLGPAQLRDIFRQASVFVFPTFFDGFGLVLLEAMASGLPVIASASCAAPELIDETGAGMICEAGDVAAWARALQSVIRQPEQWTERGIRARTSSERFSWTAYSARWAELLHRLK